MANVDKSLSFGFQNFFFVQSDTSDLTYNYYGYMNKKGTIMIMRTTKSVQEIKYFVGKGEFALVFTDFGSKTYVYPNELVDQSL